MKPKISGMQYMLLVANYLFTATLISLPQVLVQAAEQNTWMVPILSLPFLVIIIIFSLGKKVEPLKELFLMGEKVTKLQKVFVSILLFFLIVSFIRDMRALIDFTVTSLLPNTPIEILSVLSALVICYVCWTGLEVIARITVIQFMVLGGILLLLPLMLANEIDPKNLQPILGPGSLSAIVQSWYLLLGWVSEIVVFFLLLPYIDPIKNIRKLGIFGSLTAMFLLFLLIIMQLAVLGADIVKVSTFPNYQLIQQINITDFLDRLDLVIVTVWAPTILCKISLTLYCINKAVGIVRGADTNVFIIPIGLLLAILAVVLFKSNVQHLEFSFFTWPTLGLALELLLIPLFFIIRKKHVTRAKQN